MQTEVKPYLKNLLKRDLTVNWHPCMQMKDFEEMPPIEITRAHAAWLYAENGRRYLDATSSWWCKSLGHAQPSLQNALTQQLQRFEHVIFANTTYDKIIELSEKLTNLIPHTQRVLYAGDGSCAVEIAVKMAIQAQQLKGASQRQRLAALAGGYHGETILTLALSDCELYAKPFAKLLPPVHRIDPVPYVLSTEDPLWYDASQAWQQALQKLAPIADELACVICEPILQGANGMRIYSADFLKRMTEWAQSQGIYVIVDEIMTGFGRTGRMFAYEYAGIKPDMVCLGKGLTAGMLPMSAVATTEMLYELFYDDYETGKAFMHSHTHTGNALSAAVACEAVRLSTAIDVAGQAGRIGAQMYQDMQAVNAECGIIGEVSHIGAMVALKRCKPTPVSRWGRAVSHAALGHEILMRPLANTIYWLPPLISTDTDLNCLAAGTQAAILQVDDLN